jgi:predicted amidohydrolase YtcJ
MNIFYNANIYAPDQPRATAFVIDQGRFIALGSDPEILDVFSHRGTKHNLDGKTIWPGLTDAHVHLRQLAVSMAIIDCETPSRDDCLFRVEKGAAGLPEGAWVRGHGWNQNQWLEGYGTAQMLDAVSGQRPVFLTAKSLHAAWVNNLALKMAGIDSQTPDPPGGIIQRDTHGEPTGILLEGAAMDMVASIIPPPTLQEMSTQIKGLIGSLWKMGLVGVHDFDDFNCWLALQMIHQKKDLAFRIRKHIPFDHLDAFINAGIRTDYGDDWLDIGGVKLFSDGALGPQTAAMLAPYEQSSETGTLLLTEDELIDIGKHAVGHGIALAIHAIGDRANHVVLNAYEHLRKHEKTYGLPHLRHRIEHAQIMDSKDFIRLAKLDVIASVQPVHAPSDMIIANRYLGTRTSHAYAYRSILEADAPYVFGSDAPVEPVNPFHGLHAAVTRRRLDGSPGSGGWHPEQRLSLEEALFGFTQNPAEITHKGNRLGKISPGYHADFIVLEEDPFTIDPHQLGEIKPLATYIEGDCKYQSAD